MRCHALKTYAVLPQLFLNPTCGYTTHGVHVASGAITVLQSRLCAQQFKLEPMRQHGFAIHCWHSL